MPGIRIALAQCNLVVGDIAGNVDTVVAWTRQAFEAGADLVAFPEMTLTGYPPEDLVLRRSFVDASTTAVPALARRLAAEGLGEIAVAVGYLDDDHPDSGQRRNALAVLHGGHVRARYFKHHLPNYGVFDEYRYFAPGSEFISVAIAGLDVGLSICEDAWQSRGPFAVAASIGVDVMLVVNGSPYERNKVDVRFRQCQERARECGAAVAYVNTVGGQDELVFDGDSLVVAPDGELLARAAQFSEELLVVDLDMPGRGDSTPPHVAGMDVRRVSITTSPSSAPPAERPAPPAESPATPAQLSADGQPGAADPAAPAAAAARLAPRLSPLAEVWAALVTGTRDYVRKNGFTSVILGLSGGIDSALAATVACDAVGADGVHVVGMPSPWSSEHSVADAEELARRQDLRWRLIPIAQVLEAFGATYPSEGLALENLQARIRGQLLMTISNAEGPLVLATGNKSELATGFSTLYGDSAGGFAPLKDVPKTLVWELALWRNTQQPGPRGLPPIPENSISKPPSAELAPGQLDSDRLPPYEVLDAVLEAYVDADTGRAELLSRGFDEAVVDRVIRLTDLAEYKRRQYPPGPKISPKAFGRDRRLPITNRWREQSG